MFKLLNEDGSARVGRLSAGKRKVNTPLFMAVATQGTVKYLDWRDVTETGAGAVIVNAFHSFLRPGQKLIRKTGGLHEFIGFDGFIFTDSGGFQMLNNDFFVSISDAGIVFRSPYDGKKQLMTPEKVIALQEALGSDVAMMLDDVPKSGQGKERYAASLRRTHEWAKRALAAKKDKKQLLFGIAQGGTFRELREKSTRFINGLGFDGVAIGGLCIGESKKDMLDAVRISVPLISEEKPRYLMGVGSPEDIVEAISLGIDVFDSAFPTMNARHGTLFTENGSVNITKAENREKFVPIESGCSCYCCQNFSRAYLHHLFRAKEATGLRLASIHNLGFMQRLMTESREAIEDGEFSRFKKRFLTRYKNKN